MSSFGCRTPAIYTGNLVCADPPRADAPLRNAAEMRGSIALVVRGSCTFEQKAKRILECGAIAMIVANNDQEEPFTTFTMAPDDDASSLIRLEISIPCVMICFYDICKMFKEYSNAVDNVSVQLELLDGKTKEAAMASEQCYFQRQLDKQTHRMKLEKQEKKKKASTKWTAMTQQTSALLKHFGAEPTAPLKQLSETQTISPTESNSTVAVQNQNTMANSASIDEKEERCIGTNQTVAKESHISTPTFTFVQYATSVSTSVLHYAPLADFSNIEENTEIKAKCITCDPVHADQPLQNASALCNNIALVERGECTFPDKLRRIQDAGAVAAIIGNNDIEDEFAAFVMTVDKLSVVELTIPAIMVSARAFRQIQFAQSEVSVLCVGPSIASTYLTVIDRPIPINWKPLPSTDVVDIKEVLSFCRDGSLYDLQVFLDHYQQDPIQIQRVINYKDHWDLTPLHYAVSQPNSANLIKLLLKHGADRNATDILGRTPLHFACILRSIDAVNALLSHSTSACTVSHVGGDTPFHTTARKGYNDVLSCMIKAIRNQYLEERNVHQYLALRNERFETPLHVACKMHRVACVKVLLAAGARLDLKDIGKMTPLEIVCQNLNSGFYEDVSMKMMEALLLYGADIYDIVYSANTDENECKMHIDLINSQRLRQKVEIVAARSACNRSKDGHLQLEERYLHLQNLHRQLGADMERLYQRQEQYEKRELEQDRLIRRQETQLAQCNAQTHLLLQSLQSSKDQSLVSNENDALDEFQIVNSSLSHTDDYKPKEELALDAALMRDMGKKYIAKNNYTLARYYMIKSLEAFPLPGVQRLLQNIEKTIEKVAEPSESLTTSDIPLNAPLSTTSIDHHESDIRRQWAVRTICQFIYYCFIIQKAKGFAAKAIQVWWRELARLNIHGESNIGISHLTNASHKDKKANNALQINAMSEDLRKRATIVSMVSSMQLEVSPHLRFGSPSVKTVNSKHHDDVRVKPHVLQEETSRQSKGHKNNLDRKRWCDSKDDCEEFSSVSSCSSMLTTRNKDNVELQLAQTSIEVTKYDGSLSRPRFDCLENVAKAADVGNGGCQASDENAMIN